MLENLLRNKSDWGQLILRLTLGTIFLLHGSQKVTTFFGGSGFSGTAASFAEIGLYFPTLLAYLVGFAEIIGGFLLIIGLLTREVGLCLSIIMLGAIVTVHGSKGFFASNQGYEYNFALIGALLCLVFSGAGGMSMDRVLFPRERWTFIKDPSKVRLEPPMD